MIRINLLATVSAATDVTTQCYDLQDLQTFSIQVNFTGVNVVGTLKLQASLDNSTYVDVPDSSQAVTASADHIWDVVQAGYRYVRVDWDYASGTGNITIDLFVKEPIVR